LLNSSTTDIFYFKIASRESILPRTDDSDPIAKEKKHTPKTIMMIEAIFSSYVSAEMSPYPTVDSVVYVQYNALRYFVPFDSSIMSRRTTQVSGPNPSILATKNQRQAIM
jgi:hypothetical protein